jgi:hypothetical protein
MTNTIRWTTRDAVDVVLIECRNTADGWRIARFLVQPNPPPRR